MGETMPRKDKKGRGGIVYSKKPSRKRCRPGSAGKQSVSASSGAAPAPKSGPRQPPKELVSLLSSSPVVLEYFKGLQKDLVADVNKWKDRAATWKKRAEDLLKEKKRWDVEKAAYEQQAAIQAQRKHHREEREDEENYIDVSGDRVKMGGKRKRKVDRRRYRNVGENDEKEEKMREQAATEGTGEVKGIDDDLGKGEGSDDEKPADTAAKATELVPVTDEMFDMCLSSSTSSASVASSAAASASASSLSELSDLDQKRRAVFGAARNSRAATSSAGKNRLSATANAPEIPSEVTARTNTTGDGGALPSSSSSGCVKTVDDLRAIRKKLLDEARECLESLGVSTVIIACLDESKQADSKGEQDAFDNHAMPGDGEGFIDMSTKKNKDGGECDWLEKKEAFDAEELAAINKETKAQRGGKFSVRRRTDEDVAGDLMRSLRVLSRVSHSTKWGTCETQSRGSNRECNNDHGKESGGEAKEPGPVLPCFSSSSSLFGENGRSKIDGPGERVDEASESDYNPAAVGVFFACRALTILDTWSEAFYTLDEEEDEAELERECEHDNPSAIQTHNEKVDKGRETRMMNLAIVRIGLTNRRRLVTMILESVEGEASRAWAPIDRSLRPLAPSLFFSPKDMTKIDEDEEEDHQRVGADDAEASHESSKNTSDQKQFQPVTHSHNRLAALMERCMYARILSTVYRRRCDLQSVARVVVEYVLSAVPILDVEDYPKLSPPLSLCVMDAFLCDDDDRLITDRRMGALALDCGVGTGVDRYGGDGTLGRVRAISWFGRFLQSLTSVEPTGDSTNKRSRNNDLASDPVSCSSVNDCSTSESLLGKALAVAIHSTANIWTQREQSVEGRIRDISKVELASYQRLLRQSIDSCSGTPSSSWLGGKELTIANDRNFHETNEVIFSEAMKRLYALAISARDAFHGGPDESFEFSPPHSFPSLSKRDSFMSSQQRINEMVLIDAILALQLVLVSLGDPLVLQKTWQRAIDWLNEDEHGGGDDSGSHDKSKDVSSLQSVGGLVLVAVCKSQRIIESVRAESSRTCGNMLVGGVGLPQQQQQLQQFPSAPGADECSVVTMLKLSADRLWSEFVRTNTDNEKVFTSAQHKKFMTLLSSIASCAIIMSDGVLAYSMARCWWWTNNRSRHFQDGQHILDSSDGRRRKTRKEEENDDGEDEDEEQQQEGQVVSASFQRRQHFATAKSSYQRLMSIRDYPMVRVINLKRRKDRWRNIMVQAQRLQLLVVKAVVKMMPGTQISDNISDELLTPPSDRLEAACTHSSASSKKLWGEYAYDGVGKARDFEERIKEMMGDDDIAISKYVKMHWYPCSLMAVDRNATADKKRVTMDPTERACALSHIASWIGVKNSLTEAKSDKEASFLQTFQISGYARGNPLFVSANNSDVRHRCRRPTPVCVILEDDAVLVDRFTDRLDSLLQELPSDFHFCSLGYSRPKTAPMVPFSDQLGIPTYLWYLTGYILSLEGARFLLHTNVLPVVGPVDSWIGKLMCCNWKLHEQGSSAMSSSIPSASFSSLDSEEMGKVMKRIELTMAKNNPSLSSHRKKLAACVKFRCFASLIPLCSQKVGGCNAGVGAASGGGEGGTPSTTAISARVSWRERDTDIAYSGYA